MSYDYSECFLSEFKLRNFNFQYSNDSLICLIKDCRTDVRLSEEVFSSTQVSLLTKRL